MQAGRLRDIHRARRRTALAVKGGLMNFTPASHADQGGQRSSSRWRASASASAASPRSRACRSTCPEGEILSIIGPNGAGKTSLLNMISGFYRPDRGRITFEGEDITHMPPSRIAERGVARTFQNIALFKGMTVLDNLMLGRHVRMKAGVFSSFVYWGFAQKEEMAHREESRRPARIPEARGSAEKAYRRLSYGLQKRVELGRALALEPKVLLLDEPMSGMNQEEKEDMARYVLDVNEERGTTHHPDRARHGRGHGHLEARGGARPRPPGRRRRPVGAGESGSDRAYLGTNAARRRRHEPARASRPGQTLPRAADAHQAETGADAAGDARKESRESAHGTPGARTTGRSAISRFASPRSASDAATYLRLLATTARACRGATRGVVPRRDPLAAVPGRPPTSSSTCSSTRRRGWSSPRTRSRSTRFFACPLAPAEAAGRRLRR